MNTERTDAERGPEATVETAAMVATEANAAFEEDTEEIAATLRGIAEDGVLTDESVQEALAHLSKVVSTPATRVELSGIELDSVREDASEVADVPTVAARVGGFAAEVDRIESAVTDLDRDLRALTDRATEVSVVGELSGEAALALYEIAAERRRIHAEATRLQGAADDLTMEIESFGRWLDQASVRHEELRTDATEFADAVDALETDVDEVADASGSGGAEIPDDDVAQMLFECSLRHRVLTLQALDLRSAAADLEIVDRRSESDPDNSTLSVVREHVGELEDHLSSLDDRLDAIDYAEWHNQYDSRLAAFDEELKRFNPPVDWGAVLSALQEAQNN